MGQGFKTRIMLLRAVEGAELILGFRIKQSTVRHVPWPQKEIQE